MLTLVLITTILATSPPPGPGATAPLREGRETGAAPKPIASPDPDRRRAIFAGKVETAWVLADEVFRSEPEACP